MRLTPRSRIRRELQDRQGNRCAYCEVEMLNIAADGYTAEDATVDHVMPLALGGADDVMNRVAACRRCNEMKGCRTPDDLRVMAWALDDQAARLWLIADRMEQTLRPRSVGREAV